MIYERIIFWAVVAMTVSVLAFYLVVGVIDA